MYSMVIISHIHVHPVDSVALFCSQQSLSVDSAAVWGLPRALAAQLYLSTCLDGLMMAEPQVRTRSVTLWLSKYSSTDCAVNTKWSPRPPVMAHTLIRGLSYHITDTATLAWLPCPRKSINIVINPTGTDSLPVTHSHPHMKVTRHGDWYICGSVLVQLFCFIISITCADKVPNHY